VKSILPDEMSQNSSRYLEFRKLSNLTDKPDGKEKIMKKWSIRIIKSFIYSAFIGFSVNWLVSVILYYTAGIERGIATDEFMAMFPTATIACGVDLMLYGLIGAAFSGMMAIYEINRIGFVLQNTIYVIATSAVWIPVLICLWQLNKYPYALFYTVMGFVMTYVIMTIVALRTTRQDILQINERIAAIAE